MNYRDKFHDRKSCLLHYAELKATLIKRRTHTPSLEAWNAVPVVSVDAKWGDIVKDYSVDSTYGHVGVVSQPVERFTKRDGREAVRIYIEFINHTTVKTYPDVKTRKLELIINN
jgi:hypothetical protein